MRLLQRLSDIPADATVALFGAGQAGRTFLELLRRFRRDVEAIAFIDSFKRTATDGLATIDPAAISTRLPGVTLIITSTAWREIAALLKCNGIDDIFVAAPHFLYPSALPRLNAAPDATTDPLFRPPLSDRECAEYHEELETVAALLSAPEEVALFRMLTCPEQRGDRQLEAIGDHFLSNAQRGQYLDFIRYEAVKTIIEGGVYDGGDSLNFLARSDAAARVYGFEPGRDGFQAGGYGERLGADPRFQLIPYALWSESTRLAFVNNGRASHLAPPTDETPADRIVDTKSIDDFVHEREIPRVDLIKLDIEGAELPTLRGALATLRRDRPQLAICIYHRPRDYIDIPRFIAENLPDYRHHLGHYTATNLESVWYAIPKEIADTADIGTDMADNARPRG